MMTTTDKGETGDGGADEDELVENASTLRMVLLTVIVMTTVMTPGNAVTFSSIALPQIILSLEEVSWFTSLPYLAAPFGTLFIALTMDTYGRRICVLTHLVPNTVGWFILADENPSVTQLYLSRLLVGFALGAATLPCVVYVAECVTVNRVRIRTAMNTWVIFSMVIGGLLMYVLSLTLPYNKVAGAFGIVSAISLFLFFIFIPESPAWLYQKGRVGDADVAQQRLGIRQPLRAARKTLPAADDDSMRAAEADPDSSGPKSLTQYLSQIRRRDVYKPLIVTVGFKFVCDFSGVYFLQSNMVDLITVYPFRIDPYVLSFICEVIQIIGCSLLTILLPRFGVKTLSTVSFVGFLVLAFSTALENSSSSNIFYYLHIASVWATMLASRLGILAIPYAILGEVFPIGAKGYATLTLLLDSLFKFIGLKIFPYAFLRYRSALFLVLSVVCAFGAAFAAACLPETVGKTMEEINEGFEEATSKGDTEGE